MKISYQWLKEFVAVQEEVQAVADRLSLAGLEVAGVASALPPLEGLLVGEITEVRPHPNADKLTICRVETGAGPTSQIVCGAPNVRSGMKAPVILPGSCLPDGTKIRRAKLRGVESAGMLCSARELGLSDDHSGLWALPPDAPVGQSLTAYLGAGDSVIDIEITPNRGDCLSLLGVARDVSTLYDIDLRIPAVDNVPAAHEETVTVELRAPEGCPIFLGQIIRGIDPAAETPLWMRERLRRAGIRPISPAVDVTQYVMLEFGQPMHAYDLREIHGGIVVRMAEAGETLRLLDGSAIDLETDMLVIADHERVVGLAGIMGGEGSGIRDDTTDVYLECAWFQPEMINGRSRRLGISTDAAYRYERGVDPAGQRRAIQRAAQLLTSIAGGRPGPVEDTRREDHVPRRNSIRLRRRRLEGLLGVTIPEPEVERILARLDMPVERVEEGWQVVAPTHRFDIEIEEDLIEEVGRIYGYDHIEPVQYPACQAMTSSPEATPSMSNIRAVLVQRGYQEVITYSFVARELQETLTGASGIELANPITADMTHMRTMLWPGLVQVLQYNQNRQQSRVRIFEVGLRFQEHDGGVNQEAVLSALICGDADPEQWGLARREADFFDLKGDLESLLALTGRERKFQCVPDEHPALHPGQTASVQLQGQRIGYLGAIHPRLQEQLGLNGRTLVMEIALESLRWGRLSRFTPLSRFPSIRRDLAVVVPQTVRADAVRSCVTGAAGELLRDMVLFDVYQGKGVPDGFKSLALGLILQDYSRTLTDDEVDEITNRVVGRLGAELNASLRG